MVKEKVMHRRFRFQCLAFVLAVALLSSGCATPIGVTRGSIQDTYYALTANVLSAGKPSSWSMQVFNSSNLTEQFDQDPEAALKEMRNLST